MHCTILSESKNMITTPTTFGAPVAQHTTVLLTQSATNGMVFGWMVEAETFPNRSFQVQLCVVFTQMGTSNICYGGWQAQSLAIVFLAPLSFALKWQCKLQTSNCS